MSADGFAAPGTQGGDGLGTALARAWIATEQLDAADCMLRDWRPGVGATTQLREVDSKLWRASTALDLNSIPAPIIEPFRELRVRLQDGHTRLKTAELAIDDWNAGQALDAVARHIDAWGPHQQDAAETLAGAQAELDAAHHLLCGRQRAHKAPRELRERDHQLRRQLKAQPAKLATITLLRENRPKAKRVLMVQAAGTATAHTVALALRPRVLPSGEIVHGHTRWTGGSAPLYDSRSAAVTVTSRRRGAVAWEGHLRPFLAMAHGAGALGAVHAISVTDTADDEVLGRLDVDSLAYYFADLRDGLRADVRRALDSVGVARPDGAELAAVCVEHSNRDRDADHPGRELAPHHHLHALVPLVWVVEVEGAAIPELKAVELPQPSLHRFRMALEEIRRHRMDLMLGALVGKWRAYTSEDHGCTAECHGGGTEDAPDLGLIAGWCFGELRGGQHAVEETPRGLRALTAVSYQGVLACSKWDRLRRLHEMSLAGHYSPSATKNPADPLSPTPDADEAVTRSMLGELSFPERHFARIEGAWETTPERAAEEYGHAVVTRMYHISARAAEAAKEAEARLNRLGALRLEAECRTYYVGIYSTVREAARTEGLASGHAMADRAARAATGDAYPGWRAPSDRTLGRVRGRAGAGTAHFASAERLRGIEQTAHQRLVAASRASGVANAALAYALERQELLCGPDEWPETEAGRAFCAAMATHPADLLIPDERTPWSLGEVLRDSEIVGLKALAAGKPSASVSPGLAHQAMAAARMIGQARDMMGALAKAGWEGAFADPRLSAMITECRKARDLVRQYQTDVPANAKEWFRWREEPQKAAEWAFRVHPPMLELVAAMATIRQVAMVMNGSGLAAHCRGVPLREWVPPCAEPTNAD